jgi:hypothetical protein
MTNRTMTEEAVPHRQDGAAGDTAHILLRDALAVLGLSAPDLHATIAKAIPDGHTPLARSTVYRWINGSSPISPALWLWLRERLEARLRLAGVEVPHDTDVPALLAAADASHDALRSPDGSTLSAVVGRWRKGHVHLLAQQVFEGLDAWYDLTANPAVTRRQCDLLERRLQENGMLAVADLEEAGQPWLVAMHALVRAVCRIAEAFEHTDQALDLASAYGFRPASLRWVREALQAAPTGGRTRLADAITRCLRLYETRVAFVHGAAYFDTEDFRCAVRYAVRVLEADTMPAAVLEAAYVAVVDAILDDHPELWLT